MSISSNMVRNELKYFINDAILDATIDEMDPVRQLVECELTFEGLEIPDFLPLILFLLVSSISVGSVKFLLACSHADFSYLFNFVG